MVETGPHQFDICPCKSQGNSMEYIIVTCFYHSSCSSSVRFLVSS